MRIIDQGSTTLKLHTDYYKRYLESEEGKTINRFDYGMLQLRKIAIARKNGFISKREYTFQRNDIEQQLLDIK